MAIEINQDAFERCVRLHGTAVYRVAWAHSLSKSESDDVFQETFIALWRSGKRFESEEHIRRWLLKVASYKSKDALRAASRRVQGCSLLEKGVAECIAAPEEESADAEVWSVVACLPEDMRVVVVMHYGEGYSTEEIADMCGCAHATVRTRLFRARRKLRNILEEK